MDILDQTWLQVLELPVYERTLRFEPDHILMNYETKPLIITGRYFHEYPDGRKEYEAWDVRPGDVFARMLIGPGAQTALLTQEILRFDPYRQKYEKRLARYLSWQWRIKRQEVVHRHQVRTILNNIQLSDSNLEEAQEKFENALECLLREKIIAHWQYEKSDDYVDLQARIRARECWRNSWLRSVVLIEPPMYVLSQPRRAASSPKSLGPEKTEGAKLIRSMRSSLGLSVSLLADILHVSVEKLFRLECGAEPLSEEQVQVLLQLIQHKLLSLSNRGKEYF